MTYFWCPRRNQRWVLAVCVVSLAGCDSGLPRATVTGTVKLDGQPVESGAIAFVPIEGTKGGTAGAVIEKGSYRIDRVKGVMIGQNRVELRGSRKTGRMLPDPINPGGKIEERVELFPPFYSTKSTLVREVVAGENRIDFDLSSKPTAATQ
jgi:hypothetical protein